MVSGRKTNKAVKAKKVASAAGRAPAKAGKAPPKKTQPKKPAPAKKAAPPKPVKKGAAKPPKAAKKAPPTPKAPPPKAASKPAKEAPPKAPPPKPAPTPKPAKAAPPKAPPPKPAPSPKPAKAAAPAPAPQPPKAAAPKAEAPEPPKPKAPKRKPIPTTSLAATPVIRPLGEEAAAAPAPPPPPAKPGHVDHQVLSAISYGLFAAINKTFGYAGQSVLKNASLRMLEYGYKRGWLPPKSREPVRALNEFFNRLEVMGYADRIHIAKRDEGYVLEVSGLADFDALYSLRELHYPLLPIFLGEMLTAIMDQYFQLKVTTEPVEMQEMRRGFSLGFSVHERPVQPDAARIVTTTRFDDLED